MDTADDPDSQDLPSLLLPEGTLPLGHQRAAVCYNEALLRGWVPQPSPCCAAASVAGAFNALRGAARGTPRALTHAAVLTVLEETLRERIVNLRARFERLLGSSVAPLLDALRERVAADGRALGGAGERAAPRRYLLRQVRALVAERAAAAAGVRATGDVCEGGCDQQPDAFQRLAELLEEEAAAAGGGASGDERLGGDGDGDGGGQMLLPPPRARAQREGRRSSQQDDADASGEEADAAEQGACETQTATATAITTTDSSSSGLLPLPPETAREARQQQRRRSLSSRSPWCWKTDLYELLKAMGGLEKLTSKRPSTAAFGNAGVIRAVNRLSANGISDAVHYGPTHGSSGGGGGCSAARVSARLFMGRAHRSGGGIDVPLSCGDDAAAVAAQWAALREAFCKEGQVVLFHLKNHYALVFALREWCASSSSSGGGGCGGSSGACGGSSGATSCSAFAAAVADALVPCSIGSHDASDVGAGDSDAQTEGGGTGDCRGSGGGGGGLWTRKLLTARRGQRPSTWVDFAEARETMLGWEGYKMLLLRREEE